MSSKISRKVDWLTWVHRTSPAGEGSNRAFVSAVIDDAVYKTLDKGIADWLLENASPVDYGRAPYNLGWRDKQRGVTIWASERLPHFTIEVSGRGCDELQKRGWLEPVIEAVQGMMTRIDIAVDMETDVQPREFAAARENKRAKTTAEMSSSTGETVYVGSMHSERYARVYRYAAPHPRHHLLRVEHVYRRDYAKKVAALVARETLRTVCASSSELYGWVHPLVESWGKKVVDIQTPRPERNGGKTLTWLIRQCAPAFRKMCAEGVIEDPVRFLEIYFLSEHIEKG